MLRVFVFTAALLSAVATSPGEFVGTRSGGQDNTDAAGQQANRSTKAIVDQRAEGDANRTRGDAVSEAQKSARAASQLASSRIASINELVQKLKSDVHNGTIAAGMARDIWSKASQELKERRLEAERAFQAKLHALNATQLKSASGETVKAAVKAANTAERNLTRVQFALCHVARANFRALRRANLAHTGKMWKEARQAAHQARHAEHQVSRAMRKAGAHEETYERVQGHSEQLGDRFLGQAEEAAEHAQGLIEHQFGHVEHELEHREDVYSDGVEHDHAVRKRTLHEAEGAITRARAAAAVPVAHAKATNQTQARDVPAAAAPAPAGKPADQTRAGGSVARAKPTKQTREEGAGKPGGATDSSRAAPPAKSTDQAEEQSAGKPEGATVSPADQSGAAFLASAPATDSTEDFILPAAGGALLVAAVASVVVVRARGVRIGEQPLLG